MVETINQLEDENIRLRKAIAEAEEGVVAVIKDLEVEYPGSVPNHVVSDLKVIALRLGGDTPLLVAQDQKIEADG